MKQPRITRFSSEARYMRLNAAIARNNTNGRDEFMVNQIAPFMLITFRGRYLRSRTVICGPRYASEVDSDR